VSFKKKEEYEKIDSKIKQIYLLANVF